MEENNGVYHLLLSNESDSNKDATSSFAETVVKMENGCILEVCWVHEHRFLLITPKILERIYSTAGRTLRDRRTRLSPEYFEEQMFYTY